MLITHRGETVVQPAPPHELQSGYERVRVPFKTSRYSIFVLKARYVAVPFVTRFLLFELICSVTDKLRRDDSLQELRQIHRPVRARNVVHARCARVV